MSVRRSTRWVIGLLITGVLGLVSAVLLVVAAGLALGRAGAFETGPGPDAARASATVIDVDSFGDDEFGYDYVVDVQFSTPDGTEVVSVDWPEDGAPPRVGDVVEVEYDRGDPEWAEVAPAEEPADPLGAAEPGEGTDPAAVAAWGGGFGALTLVALAATVVWARRAPRPERPGRYGTYGYPTPYGYPAPYGHPPAHGYPPAHAYPPPAGSPPAYGHPPPQQPDQPPQQPSQPPSRPSAPGPPTPGPPTPGPPTAPPGGWPTPR